MTRISKITLAILGVLVVGLVGGYVGAALRCGRGSSANAVRF